VEWLCSKVCRCRVAAVSWGEHVSRGLAKWWWALVAKEGKAVGCILVPPCYTWALAPNMGETERNATTAPRMHCGADRLRTACCLGGRLSSVGEVGTLSLKYILRYRHVWLAPADRAAGRASQQLYRMVSSGLFLFNSDFDKRLVNGLLLSRMIVLLGRWDSWDIHSLVWSPWQYIKRRGNAFSATVIEH
jgi:hypothetical protein